MTAFFPHYLFVGFVLFSKQTIVFLESATEDGGNIFLRNVGMNLQNDTALLPRTEDLSFAKESTEESWTRFEVVLSKARFPSASWFSFRLPGSYFWVPVQNDILVPNINLNYSDIQELPSNKQK
jgi:hypothetical protein